MAKIKSTLDLVMERTKNLNMTDQDKEKAQAKQNAQKARVWVQKYLGRKMNTDELRNNVELQRKVFPQINDLVCKELAGFLEPAGDNTMVLDALERSLDVDTQSITKLMQSHQTDLKTKMSLYTEQIISSLNQEGFSGSSLVPNLKRNTSWLEYVTQAREDLQARIISVIDTETSSP